MVKVMRENGVTYLKTPEMEIHLAPQAPKEDEPTPTPKRNLTPQEQFAQPYFKL